MRRADGDRLVITQGGKYLARRPSVKSIELLSLYMLYWFHKDAIITLKGMSKAKVKDVFRVCGSKDLIALMGPGLEGLGLPEHMDGRGHQARLKWLFNPANTGLRLVDLTNHALVLFTLEFPSEVFKSDLNP
jgi:hypothetical protein